MLQIQFLDYNVIDALVPALTLKPEHLVFIYDQNKISEKYTENLTKALKAHLAGMNIAFVNADMYRISDIMDKIKKGVSEHAGEKVCIDITGGSEIMTAAGFLLSEKFAFQIVYTNLAKGSIFDVMKEQEIAKVNHISLDDYMTAIGAKRSDDSHPVPCEKEYRNICNVAEYLFDHLSEWHALHNILKGFAQSKSLTFTIRKNITYQKKSYPSERILNVFCENGFTERLGDNSYRFTSEKNKAYMMVYGVWLEMYVYIRGERIFDEIYLGVTLDWDNEDADDTTDNEIDVVAIKNSVPVFISCKMRKPDAKDIYEVAYLADRFGGPEAKAIIATTYPVRRDKGKRNGLFNRLMKMNVGFVETRSIPNAFAAALKTAE